MFMTVTIYIQFVHWEHVSNTKRGNLKVNHNLVFNNRNCFTHTKNIIEKKIHKITSIKSTR